MSYGNPLFIRKNIKQELILNGIFVAQYWPEVLENIELYSIEKEMVEYIIPLPIDQRYGMKEMEYIVGKITDILG